jgi:sugar/nucleoside kinase (ribokinase family)
MTGPTRTQPSLLCIGNLTIDEAVHGGVRGEPAMGGDAAYAALAARLYLENVSMLAPVGNDLPSWVMPSLRGAGVRVDDTPTRDLKTVRNVVTYHSDGSRSWQMSSSESEFDALSVYPKDVSVAGLSADGIVLLAMSLGSQLSLTPWIRSHSDATVYLDLQEDYLDGNREELFGIISACDVFLPSEIEAVTLAGTTDLAVAARTFRALGPRVVVIKRAEKGSLVLDDDTVSEVPTTTVDPIDSTGAGDAFCGAFAAAHLASGDVIQATVAGSRAARIAIDAFGIAGLLVAATNVQRETLERASGATDTIEAR